MNKENSNVLPQADTERLNVYLPRDHMLTPDEVSALLIAHGFTDQSDRPLESAHG